MTFVEFFMRWHWMGLYLRFLSLWRKKIVLTAIAIILAKLRQFQWFSSIFASKFGWSISTKSFSDLFRPHILHSTETKSITKKEQIKSMLIPPNKKKIIIKLKQTVNGEFMSFWCKTSMANNEVTTRRGFTALNKEQHFSLVEQWTVQIIVVQLCICWFHLIQAILWCRWFVGPLGKNAIPSKPTFCIQIHLGDGWMDASQQNPKTISSSILSHRIAK